MISAILAVDENLAIGYQNKILFKNKVDMSFFKKVSTTIFNCVVGRITYESLSPHYLPNRNLIKITTGVNIEDIKNQYNDLLVIGGSQIYELFKDSVDVWYVTYFKSKAELADTYLSNTLHEYILSYKNQEILHEDTTLKIVKYSNKI